MEFMMKITGNKFLYTIGFIAMQLLFMVIFYKIVNHSSSAINSLSQFVKLIIFLFLLMPISLLIYRIDAKKLFNYYEFFLIFFLALNICFIFGNFGPVLIDRSISYQMVMSASGNQININSLNRTCSESNTKRLVELRNLGLIEIKDSYFIATYLKRYDQIHVGLRKINTFKRS